MELPSGDVHVFDDTHRLVRIFNRFGGGQVSYLGVEYTTDEVTRQKVVTVTDSHGREWRVFWSPYVLHYGGFDPPPVLQRTFRQIHKVEVPGFGNRQATYTFHYGPSEAIVPGCAWSDYDPRGSGGSA